LIPPGTDFRVPSEVAGATPHRVLGPRNQGEDTMAKKKSRKKTTKVRDLPVRKGANVKGGSATSGALKAIGKALGTAARGG
jgi:hypothetical protein